MFKKTPIIWTVVFGIFLFTSCSIIYWIDPLGTQFEDGEVPALLYEAKEITTPPAVGSSLTVMTFNIKFGGGRFVFYWEREGTKYNMTEDEVNGTMAEICALIAAEDPDILLVQEADRNSKRSAYVDQTQYILDNTNLNYAAYAAIWKSDLIPSDGMQRMDSGNIVLSKWPLTEATRKPLVPNESGDALKDYFYFRRNIVRAKIDIPNYDNLYVLNVHAEPFATGAKDDNHVKKQHIDAFKDEMDRLVLTGATVIGGGDFNAVPEGSAEYVSFPDLVVQENIKPDDYEGEELWLKELYDTYNSAIPLAVFHADQAANYTFPSTYYADIGTQTEGSWNRTLDYLFSNSTFSTGSVRQGIWSGSTSGLPLSDHAPIVAEMDLP